MIAVRTSERRALRRRTWWALLFSLLAHLTAIVGITWIYLSRPPQPQPEPVEEIEITMIEPPAAEKTKFIDTKAPESTPPEQAVFEADRNTAAAAPQQGADSAPLPTQDGREQPFVELEEQALALAKPDVAPPAPEVPPSQPAPPAPLEPEKSQPEAKPEEKKPAEPEEDALLAVAAPQKKPEERKEVPQPPAPPPPRPSYQREARATRLSGSVSNRGKAAVAALATPLGRYRKAISDAIGSSWYHHIGSRMDMFNYGTITVVFIIDRNGKARRPKVVSNTSNESFEIVTLESILSAEIPPIPPDILPTLEGGQIEIDYSFSIITN
jgi:outer membrane biosynthesis protein TonB